MLKVIGWGVLEFGSSTLADPLMQTTVPVVSMEMCMSMSSTITEKQFCAGRQEGM